MLMFVYPHQQPLLPGKQLPGVDVLAPHPDCPGVQTPVQAPPVAVAVHACGQVEDDHWPTLLQVCSVNRSLHWVAPGLQTPVHAPPVQT
jgi:hypothetical protein